MRLTRPITVLTAAFLTAVTLVGCSPAATESAPDAQSPVDETSEDVATADPPSVSAAAILTDTWTDAQGYSFTFSLDQGVVSGTADELNAPPGEVDITWSFDADGTVANTTDSRNATSPTIGVEPIWASTRTLCSVTSNPEGTFRAFNATDPSLESSWCTLSGMPGQFVGVDISVGEAVVVEASRTPTAPVRVPEDSADAVLAELTTPDGWLLLRVGDYETSEATNCNVGAGGSTLISAATVATGCVTLQEIGK